MAPDSDRIGFQTGPDRSLAAAALIGRLVAHLVPVALVIVMAEAVMALSMYPALRDVLQESWVSLGLRLWSVSLPFVLALAMIIAGVAFALQRYLGGRSSLVAGVIVTIAMVAAAVPVVLGVVFPSRIPWDRSLLAVSIAFVVVTPIASTLVGLSVRWAMNRGVGMALAATAGLSVLLAVPGLLYDLRVEAGPPLEVSPAASREPGQLTGASVVLVTVDTLRASHTSVYGYARDTTPGIKAWAEKHTVFTHAITPRTFTAPAIASLMTGLYPGLHGVGRHPDRLPDAMVTLAELFADHGYRTAGYVTNPALHRPIFNFGQGFAEWHEYPNEQSRAELVLKDAQEFLARPDESPFFLWVHLIDPHSPYRPPEPYDTRFVDDELYGQFQDVVMYPARGGWGPGEVSLRDALGADWTELGLSEDTLRSADYLVSQYDGEIAYLDEQVSMFLEAVGDRHRDALVILTADHGESLVEHEYFFTHGRFCYEPTARVPLVVAHPSLAPGRVDEVISLVDLLPTVIDLIGLRSPSVLEGRSLSGFLTGELKTNRIATSPAAGAVRLGARSTNSYPTLCLRSPQWKLVLTPARYTQPLDLVLEAQLRRAGVELPRHFYRAYHAELYDLDADPQEVVDVAAARHDVNTQLQRRLWTTILEQRNRRDRIGQSFESEIHELDEDTIRELRTLGYVR